MRVGRCFAQTTATFFGETTLWLGKTTKPSVWAERKVEPRLQKQTMKIKFVTTTAAALLVASAGMAQSTMTTTTSTTTHTWWTSHWTMKPDADRYTANEASLDMFGSYIAGQRGIENLFDTNIRHGDWGGGVGLNYFFTREI